MLIRLRFGKFAACWASGYTIAQPETLNPQTLNPKSFVVRSQSEIRAAEAAKAAAAHWAATSAESDVVRPAANSKALNSF